MQIGTKGIVLSTIKYRETSVITKLFTEKLGTQSYIVNGVRAAKPKWAPSLFEPLTQLNLEVKHSPKGDLHRFNEVYCDLPYTQIPTDRVKSSIRFFIAELCAKVLANEQPNPELYQFISTALQVLDLMGNSASGYPLQFLIKLSQPMGFAPSSTADFLDHLAHPAVYELELEPKEQANLVLAYLTSPFTNPPTSITSDQRHYLLYLVLDYWSGHLNTNLEFRSLDVLRKILN